MRAFKIDVVLAYNHPGMILGVAYELASSPIIDLKGCAENFTNLVVALEKEACHVLVSDYFMPTGKYSDSLKQFEFLIRRFPDVKIVVLTVLENPAILASLNKLGVSAIVSKADAESNLMSAILAANAGGKYHSPTIEAALLEARRDSAGGTSELSPRESEVIRLYAAGMRVDDIAVRLGRSKKTIRMQMARAMQKLGISRDTDLMKYALVHGWVASTQGSPDA
ncbi:LuxR C-terminal-related transcriptional regulator [Burkholderia pyrrocinia]|uniref:LuxR C-terminal-related transcriptional regulator n=1 Tax=Burkholderia pyrrocinia TaxID=60550 RepID=UPI0010477CA3|nr:LuxR C-terminal-related transcriptional regulator [Burkholderia pyrrocinia]TDA47888.1 response regulator [Burkholderia pyrrocinia]